MQQPRSALTPTEYDSPSVARTLADSMADKKASDVTLIEVGKATTLADFFVIATGSSERHVNALRQHVQDHMREGDIILLNDEGVPAEGWVLLDYGQVVVHIFGPEERAYYDLDHRWKEAPTLLRIQ